MPHPQDLYGTAMHGWLILDKPVGLGSTQAVAAVKRALRDGGYAKVRVGHGGTLDPLASGVLPIALGEATKLAGRMLDASKVYEFAIGFGAQTDTLDLEGVIVATSNARPTIADVEAVLPGFTGEIEQLPPVYSAIRVDGERAYDRARAGEDVSMSPRVITVHSIRRDAGADRGPVGSFHAALEAADNRIGPGLSRDDGVDGVTLSAHVSKGTYIRSLARDVALALGTVGHVTVLRRTRAGPFALDQAISLDKLTKLGKGRALEEALLPLDAGLDGIPALDLTPDQAASLRQGRTLSRDVDHDGLHFAKLGTVPVALVKAGAGSIRVVRGFNLPPGTAKDEI